MPEVGESRLTDYLEGVFRGLGLPIQRQAIQPGRDNLLARVDGSVSPESGGPLLLFSVHQDTVPATGMTVPPFDPQIREGRLYGRGACDVKGGMAAMIAALARLAETVSVDRPTVVLACTVNEECGFDGADALPRLWREDRSGMFPRKPDAAIVAEPTELKIVVAHKGLVRWRCHARGRAAHSAYPQAGDNAVYKMGRVLTALERYQREVVGTLAAHPLCGPGTLNVGTIVGGVSVNTVPDRCTIEIDRRLSPQEEPRQARQQVIDYLDEALGLGDQLEHDPPFMAGRPLSDAANGDLAERLAAVVRRRVGDCSKLGVPYATDGASLAVEGIPTVVFGPGSIAQAHTADEWIALDQVEQAAEILVEFAAKGSETGARRHPR